MYWMASTLQTAKILLEVCSKDTKMHTKSERMLLWITTRVYHKLKRQSEQNTLIPFFCKTLILISKVQGHMPLVFKENQQILSPKATSRMKTT